MKMIRITRKMAAVAAASVAAAVFGDGATAFSGVYDGRNVEVVEGGVALCEKGERLVDGGFAQSNLWSVANYSDRLGVAVGAEVLGSRGLRIDGAKVPGDTAWRAESVKIDLKGAGSRYRLTFSVRPPVNLRNSGIGDDGWGNRLCWYGASGETLAIDAIPYDVRSCVPEEITIKGLIPHGAKSFSARFGFDWPNLTPGACLFFGGFDFDEICDSPEFQRTGGFTSEIRPGGGTVAWTADVPDGCAVRFQWRGADDAEELASRPFSGPDGTPGTYFEGPFPAAARFMQYRVSLASDGRATPVLKSVSGNGWSDGPWAMRTDGNPPRVRLACESPASDARQALKLRIADDKSAVAWRTLRVSIDGEDATAAARREGDVVSFPGREQPWAPGLHEIDVTVADIHGNVATSRKAFFVGEAPKTPKVTLRDDGMTLIDGKPFFPIGIYGVCKRPFNGNSYDAALKSLREAGFNMAHTYGDAYDPEFLEAVHKYGLKLWVEARFPDAKLIEKGRHDPAIIAWYLGDDTSDHISPNQEADYDEAVKAVDPTRLSVQADPIGAYGGGASRYADYVTATDGFMPEIYPVRGDAGDKCDATCVAETILDMKMRAEDVRLNSGGTPRTCWPILQYFKGWGNWRHFPTREQLFATTFAAIVHGANGVTWYTYGGFDKNEGVTSTPERWRDICDLAGRLALLSPVLVERTPAQPPAPAVTSGPKTDFHGNPSVTSLFKRHGGRGWMFAVNAAAEPVSARIVWPDDAESVKVLFEDRSVECVGGAFIDRFEPFAVHIYAK